MTDCAICLQLLRIPVKVLVCGHSFCSPCLHGMRQQIGSSWNVGGRITLACPACRRETVLPNGRVSDLPTNFALNEFLEREMQIKGISTEQEEIHVMVEEEIKSSTPGQTDRAEQQDPFQIVYLAVNDFFTNVKRTLELALQSSLTMTPPNLPLSENGGHFAIDVSSSEFENSSVVLHPVQQISSSVQSTNSEFNENFNSSNVSINSSVSAEESSTSSAASSKSSAVSRKSSTTASSKSSAVGWKSLDESSEWSRESSCESSEEN